jgi:hypothetical protein
MLSAYPAALVLVGKQNASTALLRHFGGCAALIHFMEGLYFMPAPLSAIGLALLFSNRCY